MSQEKVDRYKNEKAHRKETLEKEKKKQKQRKILGYAALAVLVLGIAFGVYWHMKPVTPQTAPAVAETDPASEAETQSLPEETQTSDETAATAEAAATAGTAVPAETTAPAETAATAETE